METKMHSPNCLARCVFDTLRFFMASAVVYSCKMSGELYEKLDTAGTMPLQKKGNLRVLWPTILLIMIWLS